jgi:O-antigen/teichoic acid export membrane protein
MVNMDEVRRRAERNMKLTALGIVAGVAAAILLGIFVNWWIAAAIGIAVVAFFLGWGIYAVIWNEFDDGFIRRARYKQERLEEKQTHE